jgi:hypothetical protein
MITSSNTLEAPADISKLLARFTGPDLTRTLSRIEAAVQGVTVDDCATFLECVGAVRETLTAAAEMKRLAGQINVTVHALGILLCLPHIPEPGEHVEFVSLGAGNTGRKFDLETNLRVAEFKFIHWRGGATARKRFDKSPCSRTMYCWQRSQNQNENSYISWASNTR